MNYHRMVDNDLIIKKIELASYYFGLIGNIALFSLGIIMLAGEGPIMDDGINKTTVGVLLVVFSMTCITTFLLYISTLVVLSTLAYSYIYVVNYFTMVFRKRVHNVSLEPIRSDYISIV